MECQSLTEPLEERSKSYAIQFSMMHRFSIQFPFTSTHIASCDVKNVPHSSQIELLMHAVEIRLRCLLELTIIAKPLSMKTILLVSKQVEIAGCQVW